MSAVSAKNFRFNCLAGFLQGQLPFFHFSHFSDIHTLWRTLADIMSKSKYALKTTKIIYAVWLEIYAVWLEIYAVWLGIYAVSVSQFFGGGFQGGHMSYAFFMRRKSPPHLWNLQNPIPLKTSQFAGTIQNPKTSVSSKKLRLRVGPSNFSPNINNYCCLRCSRYSWGVYPIFASNLEFQRLSQQQGIRDV